MSTTFNQKVRNANSQDSFGSAENSYSYQKYQKAYRYGHQNEEANNIRQNENLKKNSSSSEMRDWLHNIRGSWRDAECPCGSKFHFEGKIDDLFAWERIHLRHMAQDAENHDMLSFYPKDMVIYYHSKSGYVVERRRHRAEEINELHYARIYGQTKLAGV